jgi:hypothetical protein
MLAPGDPVGVANSFEGMPANASTNTSTNTATTVITQGTANLSLRGGSVPRYPGARGGWLIRRRRVSREPHPVRCYKP